MCVYGRMFGGAEESLPKKEPMENKYCAPASRDSVLTFRLGEKRKPPALVQSSRANRNDKPLESATECPCKEATLKKLAESQAPELLQCLVECN